MEEAEAAYANAVLLAPSLQMARYQLGLLQFTSSRPAVALVTWGPLFQLPPDSALQRIVHGFAALAQDDFAAALGAFREGMALNRDNEALNRDVQMLIDRIEARDSEKPSTSPTASTAVPADEPAAEDEGLHVLLANYQHQGPPH
jgi:Flp pilus assembly protein TadD